jgi:hypothetical protein
VTRAQWTLLGLLVLAPLLAREAFGSPPTPSRAVRDPIVRRVQPSEVAIDALVRRDPFAGAPRTERRVSPLPAEPLVVGGPPPADAPDDDVAFATSAPSMLISVKATIIGRIPVAYLAVGSTMRIVGLGDPLGSRRIAAIDATGVTLDDGTRFGLVAAAAPAAVRTATPKHLRRPHPASSGSATTPNPQAAAASEAPATPGPLPTVSLHAYPIGSRPTSDPSAPTAFPYPFPYSPK